MRLLADENFPRPVVRMLRLQGHDVVSITETTRGIDDLEVLARTSTEERILLTFDRGFEKWVNQVKLKPSCGIILFRIPQNAPDREQTIVRTVGSRSDWAGYISVVQNEHDIEMTPLPKS